MTLKLFSPLTFGKGKLENRIVLSPMTRARTTQPGNIPNAIMADYYAQRASAGLIITEATQISNQGQGYSFTPGIHTIEHIEGWKLVTDAVHKKGGCIFLQLWHVGRMSHDSFHKDGKPVAPSAIAPDAQVWVVDPATAEGRMVNCPTPRALEEKEIKAIVNDFAIAAENAIQAGFDGVEIHGANGYLIDQFLRRTSNQRTDQYGGSQHNRIRFLKEVVNAVTNAVGNNRTGIRLSPFITERGMKDDEIIETILLAAKELDNIGLLYIHLSEADWDDAPTIPEQFRHDLREVYKGNIIVAGKYTRQRAEDILNKELVDLVAFGRPFIANPDLPRRFREALPLADFDAETLFGGSEKGYIDYPCWDKAEELQL